MAGRGCVDFVDDAGGDNHDIARMKKMTLVFDDDSEVLGDNHDDLIGHMPMREVIAGLGVIVETDALTAVFAEFFLLAHVPHVALHSVTSSFPAFCSPLDFFGAGAPSRCRFGRKCQSRQARNSDLRCGIHHFG